jgi:hypothetical protein
MYANDFFLPTVKKKVRYFSIFGFIILHICFHSSIEAVSISWLWTRQILELCFTVFLIIDSRRKKIRCFFNS